MAIHVTVDVEEMSRKLAEIQRLQNAAVPDGWQIHDDLLPSYVDLILDALGVPKDNVSELIRRYGEQAAFEREDFFSRDWLDDLWFDVVRGSRELTEFLSEALSNHQSPPELGQP